MANKKYSLRFVPKAYDDLEQIFRYISETLFAETAAINLLDDIETSIMHLCSFPLSGSPVLDEPLRIKGYRRIIVDNYMVFYLVNEPEKQVVIMRILYGAQNYRDIL